MGIEHNSIDHSAHHMPSRRERLRAFMRLKSQRRYLIGGIAALGVSTAAFAGAFANESNSPDVVKLACRMHDEGVALRRAREFQRQRPLTEEEEKMEKQEILLAEKLLLMKYGNGRNNQVIQLYLKLNELVRLLIGIEIDLQWMMV